jgi:UPF0755 protein
MSAPRRRSRPPKRASSSRTFLWLLGFLALAVVAGWAFGGDVIGDRLGGGEDDAAQATVDESPPVPFTIPEGLRREDVAAMIDETFPTQDGKGANLTGEAYLAATAPGPRGRTLAGAAKPTSLEGFLFPATYEIGSETTAGILVDAQVQTYKERTAGINYTPAAKKNLTEYDVLTIAAMIERETAVPAERALVASVIYNRLRNGMPLQIDATVQYAIGEWKKELTASDLEVDSPYNTRIVGGLPPGPIASPGEAAIVAAAKPKETDFLYYVARNDGTGRHYFSTNADDFQADYERAQANGGEQ